MEDIVISVGNIPIILEIHTKDSRLVIVKENIFGMFMTIFIVDLVITSLKKQALQLKNLQKTVTHLLIYLIEYINKTVNMCGPYKKLYQRFVIIYYNGTKIAK